MFVFVAFVSGHAYFCCVNVWNVRADTQQKPTYSHGTQITTLLPCNAQRRGQDSCRHCGGQAIQNRATNLGVALGGTAAERTAESLDGMERPRSLEPLAVHTPSDGKSRERTPGGTLANAHVFDFPPESALTALDTKKPAGTNPAGFFCLIKTAKFANLIMETLCFISNIFTMANAHKRLNKRQWKQTRFIVFQRDGYRCVQCGKPGRLECDHIKPLWKQPDQNPYDPANCQTLCRFCHIRKNADEAGEYRTRKQKLRLSSSGKQWLELVKQRLENP